MVLIVLHVLGLNGQNNEGRSLFDKRSTNRENGGQTPNKKSFRTRDGLWQVWIVWLKKLNCGSTERKSGSGRPRSLRTADNVSVIQDMICSQDDAPCSHINPCKIREHIEHRNLAWILFIKRITVTFVVADGPLTSINQTCASILAVVHVLLGRAVTEYRWGGSRNILFMRHKFLVLTVKKLLKSMYIYGSYRKIKTGVSLFWTTLYMTYVIWYEFGYDIWYYCVLCVSFSRVYLFSGHVACLLYLIVNLYVPDDICRLLSHVWWYFMCELWTYSLSCC